MKKQWHKIMDGVWRLRLGVPEALTPVKLRRVPMAERNLSAAGLTGNPRPHFVADRVIFKTTRRGCLAMLPLGKEEAVYGFGLQLSSFQQNGRKKTIRVNSDPRGDLGDSHAPVPFYLSTRGYGILADTARYCSFYCGSHADPPHGIGVTTEELYRSGKTEDSFTALDVPTASGIDLYYFAGPTMKEALQRYVLFSGGGAMPPEWGLGIFYRGYSPNDQKATAELAAAIREDHIPCDVFGLEPGWQSHSYSCSYLWDRKRFPAPEQLIGHLHDSNFRINLWEQMFVHPSSPLYRKLEKYSGDVKVWNGLVPDYTLDTPRRIFGEFQNKELIRKGIDGFKVDECDHSDFIRVAWSFPEYSMFPGGMDGEQMHGFLGIYAQQILSEQYLRNNRRTWSNVRASHALGSPYPFVLYSDLYDHRDFIRGVVTSALSGLLWTPEVRQCGSAEELLRRLQSVIFSPMALINSWMLKNPPWKQYDIERNNAGVPLDDGGELQEKCRKILQLRMRLLPYLYAAFYRYFESGIPVFRPPVLEFPHMESFRGTDDAYFVGDDLYFAPVVAGEQSRKVFLPPGEWHDFFDGNKIWQGNCEYEFSPAPEEILLFVRSGTLLPLADPEEFVSERTVYQITPHAYGRADRYCCRLFADDGESWELLQKPDCGMTLEFRAEDKVCRISAGKHARTERYRVHEVKCMGTDGIPRKLS